MPADWLDSLDSETRAKAQRMIERMKELGAPDAEEWVESEITEDIPQMVRFLVLRRLWEEIDSWHDNTSVRVQYQVAEAEKNPKGYFADAGLAMKRMIEAGVDLEDIGRVARMVAYEAIFHVLNVIDEGSDPDAGDDLPNWALIELNAEGEATRRFIEGLHESILSLDPSGREGRSA